MYTVWKSPHSRSLLSLPVCGLQVNPRSSFEKVLFVNEMKKGGLFVLGHVVVDEFGPQSRAQLKKQSVRAFLLRALCRTQVTASGYLSWVVSGTHCNDVLCWRIACFVLTVAVDRSDKLNYPSILSCFIERYESVYRRRGIHAALCYHTCIDTDVRMLAPGGMAPARRRGQGQGVCGLHHCDVGAAGRTVVDAHVGVGWDAPKYCCARLVQGGC